MRLHVQRLHSLEAGGVIGEPVMTIQGGRAPFLSQKSIELSLRNLCRPKRSSQSPWGNTCFPERIPCKRGIVVPKINPSSLAVISQGLNESSGAPPWQMFADSYRSGHHRDLHKKLRHQKTRLWASIPSQGEYRASCMSARLEDCQCVSNNVDMVCMAGRSASFCSSS